MDSSIYAFVKRKLVSHGADKSPSGLVTIENKQVFLAFVRLERAVRIADFDAVQSAVRSLDECLASIGKRQLIVFAYLYLSFSDGSPKMTHADVEVEGGRILRSVEYRRAVTSEERLIADWGSLWFKRYGGSFLRAVYSSRV